MLPSPGSIFLIRGGIVSFGPQLGGVVVFAHECEKIMLPSTIATGIIGKNLSRNFLISVCLLQFFLFVNELRDLELRSYYTVYARNLLELLDNAVQVVDVADIKVDESVKDTILSSEIESSDVYGVVL